MKEQENQCYEVICEGNEWTMKKRRDETQWESQSNECILYECQNDSGFVTSSGCKNSDLVCVDNHCVENETLTDNRVSVEIELKERIGAIEMNTSEIQQFLSTECQVDVNDVVIGYVTDEEGYIVRIIVYVNNQAVANVIASTVEELKEKEECQYEFICKMRIVRVTSTENFVSVSGTTSMKNYALTILIIASLLLLF